MADTDLPVPVLPEDTINLIKTFEGFKPDVYQDLTGVWTQGYGFTGTNIGPESPTMTIQEASDLLDQKLEFFGHSVWSMVTQKITNPNQYGALVSLAYNIGLTALRESTLLKLHNIGQPTAASNQFVLWNHAGGVVVPGLTARRQTERALYLRPLTANQPFRI